MYEDDNNRGGHRHSNIDDLLKEDFPQKEPRERIYAEEPFLNNEVQKTVEGDGDRPYGKPVKKPKHKGLRIKGLNKKPAQPKSEDTDKERRRTKRIKQNMTAMVVIFVMMFVSLIGYTSYSMAMYGSKWFASPYNTRVTHQKNKIVPGSVYDVNGLVMASADGSSRSYPQSETARKANAHILGDPYGITSGGAEALYSSYLYGFNLNVVDRIVQAYKAQDSKGNDITLTVDSDLNKYIYEQMGSKNGAVVVMNYKTGEIIGSVSRESFDIARVQELAKEEYEEGVDFFLNKVTTGKYPPGSTFKLITAVSALENMGDASDRTYNSSSEVTMNGEKITNFDGDSHGEINLGKALTVSSNTYFAQLAKDLGGDKLTKTAQNFGFNENFMFDDVIMSKSSYSPGETDNHLAWSAVGQYKDLATPLHMCMVVSALANDGVMMEPKTLFKVEDSLGMNIYTMRAKKARQATSAAVAQQMQEMMINVVEEGTGKSAAVKGHIIGGKTGSAETGDSTHAWFVGFVDSDTTPYAVAVILEDAGTGGKNAAPLAGKIFSRMLNNE